MQKRLCIIGLDRHIVEQIKKNYFGPIIFHEMIPKFKVVEGELFVEKNAGVGMLPVDKVIFHGIFENDFDLLIALAIWGGDCYPNALGMMNCRLKLPCLARALQISKYNSKRGILSSNTEIKVESETVAKWGNWHCGENKKKFDDKWIGDELAVIEPFFEGESVRIVSIGDTNLQIKLEGKSWLKSIHDESADFMKIDKFLLEDTLKIKEAFGLQMIANDYISSSNGVHHLLEVNHIPNVTRFDTLKDVYVDNIEKWLSK